MKALLKKLHMILVAYGARSRSIACYKTENRFVQDIISVLKFYCKLLWKKRKTFCCSVSAFEWTNESGGKWLNSLNNCFMINLWIFRFGRASSSSLFHLKFLQNEFKCARRLRKQIRRHLSFSCVFSFQVCSWRFKLQFSGAQIFYFTFYFTLFICLVTEMWSDIFLYCFFLFNYI